LINKASASIALGALNQTYDGSPKTVSAATTPAGLLVVITYNGNAAAPTSAGSYGVVATIDDANYAGTVAGTLVIAKATASIALGSLNHVYDGAGKSATATTSPVGLSVTLTYDGNPTPPVNAGAYAVAATVNDPNYAGAASGTLTIAKAAASVSVGNLSQIYNGSPRLVTTATNPVGLSVAITYDGSAAAPTNAGSYAVIATIADSNFAGSASGTLVVSPAAATITLGDLNQTHDGTPRVVTATTAPAGLPVTITYNGSSTVPTNAGSYAVAATIADPNYTGAASGTLVVAKGTAIVTLGNLNQAYDGTPRPVTVTTMPAGLAVVVTYNGSAAAPTNPGAYAVAVTVNDPNYNGSASGSLVISVVLQASALPTTSSGPAVTTNTDPAAPGGTWVRLAATGNNQWMQFTTTTIPAGNYLLKLVYRSAPTRAKSSVKIDNKAVGVTIDQYAVTSAYLTENVGTITFTSSGAHTFRLTTSGHNAASSGWDLSAVQFILVAQ
jgi:hypothetical protein